MKTIFENDKIRITSDTEKVWAKYGKVRVYLNEKHHLELSEMATTGDVEFKFRDIPANWSIDSGDGRAEFSHQYSDRMVRIERI